MAVHLSYLQIDASSLHISPDPKDSADDKTGTADDDCDQTGSTEDTDGCERILRQMLSVKEQVFTSAATNISKTQERQKRDYDRRHIFKTEYKPGDKKFCVYRDRRKIDTLDQQPQIHDGKSSRLFGGLGNDD